MSKAPAESYYVILQRFGESRYLVGKIRFTFRYNSRKSMPWVSSKLLSDLNLIINKMDSIFGFCLVVQTLLLLVVGSSATFQTIKKEDLQTTKNFRVCVSYLCLKCRTHSNPSRYRRFRFPRSSQSHQNDSTVLRPIRWRLDEENRKARMTTDLSSCSSCGICSLRKTFELTRNGSKCWPQPEIDHRTQEENIGKQRQR